MRKVTVQPQDRRTGRVVEKDTVQPKDRGTEGEKVKDG